MSVWVHDAGFVEGLDFLGMLWAGEKRRVALDSGCGSVIVLWACFLRLSLFKREKRRSEEEKASMLEVL